MVETIMLMGFIPNGPKLPSAAIHYSLLRSLHATNMANRMSIEAMGDFVKKKTKAVRV